MPPSPPWHAAAGNGWRRRMEEGRR